jgi:plasmid stability protein
MASITIRQLDDDVKAKLRVRAASRGRSMEAEAREILKAGLAAKPVVRVNLADSIRRHVIPLGGVDLSFSPREPARQRLKFAK